MQQNRFVVLTGHLNDYPLSDLIGILRHQRKSGRLLIEYQKGPASFFFQDGDLVDAQFNELCGLQAICFAIAQPPASFNFNPLIQPTRKSIDDSFQRTVSELFGCWDESVVQIEAERVDPNLLDVPAVSPQLSPRRVEPLALPPAPRLSRQYATSILVMAAAGLMMLGLSTVIAVTGGFRNQLTNPDVPAAAATRVQSGGEQTPTQTTSKNATEASTAKSRVEPANHLSTREKLKTTTPAAAQNSKTKNTAQSVTVVMQIENGRVLKASIANPKAGMDSYEALALRIARQRRFPSEVNGRETVKISVATPGNEPNR